MQQNPNRAPLVAAISAGPDYREAKLKQLLLKKERKAALDSIPVSDPWAHYDYDADLNADPESIAADLDMMGNDIHVDSKKMQFTEMTKPGAIAPITKNKMLMIIDPNAAIQKTGMPQVASIGGMSTIASDTDIKSLADGLDEVAQTGSVNGDGDDDIMEWTSKRQALVNSLSRGVDYRDQKVQKLVMKREAMMLSKEGQVNPWTENYGLAASTLITDEKELFWAFRDYDAEYEYEEFVPNSIAPKGIKAY